MIHDELLMVRGFTVDSLDISFMLHELWDWWNSFYSSCFKCYSWSVCVLMCNFDAICYLLFSSFLSFFWCSIIS